MAKQRHSEAMRTAQQWEIQCVLGISQQMLYSKGVYCITHKATLRQYIGATTVSFSERWKQHQCAWAFSRVPEFAAMSNQLLIAQYVADGRNFESFEFSVFRDMPHATDTEIMETEALFIAIQNPFFNIKK